MSPSVAPARRSGSIARRNVRRLRVVGSRCKKWPGAGSDGEFIWDKFANEFLSRWGGKPLQAQSRPRKTADGGAYMKADKTTKVRTDAVYRAIVERNFLDPRHVSKGASEVVLGNAYGAGSGALRLRWHQDPLIAA